MSRLPGLPLVGTPSKHANGAVSIGGERQSWLRNGVPLGIGDKVLASMTMWAANLGMSRADAWEIWRNIMLLPGTEHKRGWTISHEQEKFIASFQSATEHIKEEKDSADSVEWSSENWDEIDADGLPLGEFGPDKIMYDSGVYWLYGDSGTGKTVIAYWIAIQRARAGYTVAILDDEMGPHASKKMLLELGATRTVLQNIHYLRWGNDGNTPDLMRSGRGMASFLDEIKADMLILDCLNAFLSASDLSDNFSTDVRKFMQISVYPSRNAGRSVLVVDHVNKTGALRGSSDKMPSCDFMIEVEVISPFQKGQSGGVRLTSLKDRNSQVKGSQLEFRVSSEETSMIISHDGWIKIEAEDLISAGRKPTTREAIYNLLRDQGPMLAGEIAAELGMSMEAVRSAIRRDNEGVFTRDKDGFYDV